MATGGIVQLVDSFPRMTQVQETVTTITKCDPIAPIRMELCHLAAQPHSKSELELPVQ